MTGVYRTELELAYVKCRTLGHSWEEFPPALAARIRRIFAWEETYRCLRCFFEKYESYNQLGQIAQRQYTYPDGYKMAEKVTRAEFRLELRRRRREARKTGVARG